MAATVRQSSGATATLVTGASGSISLPAAPVTGNKLVYCQAGDKNTGALTLAGFTEVYSLLSTSVSLYLWERVSDGTETTISPSWVTAGTGSELWYVEIEDTAVSGSTWQISAQASHITDEVATASWSTGTTGTKTSAGLGIAASGVDTANNVGATTWSNSYTQAAAAAAHSGAGGLSVATKSEAAGGTTDSTFTFTTADQCSAAIVVFSKVAAGGPALNANVSHPANSLFRLRFEVQESGGVAIASAFQLRFSKNGGAYTQVTAGTDVRPAASAQFADGAATTDLLPSGTGTFVAGVGEEADAVTPSISLGASGHTELEYALTIFTGSVGDTFDFRVYKNDGTALDSYAVTPRVTAAAAGGNTYAKTGALIADTLASGADVFEAAETGKVIGGARASAADVFQATETGSLIADTVCSGADVYESSETGVLVAGTLQAGASQRIGGGSAGALIAGTLVSGADVFAATETGALTAGARVSAADVYEATETGAIRAGTQTSGADVFQATETGSLVAGMRASGADVFEATETGKVIAGARASAADVAESSRTGALSAGARASAADTFEASETGSLISGTLLRGSGQSGFVSKLGKLIAGTLTSAADAFTGSRTGALLTRAVAAAADVFQATETGSLRAGSRVEGTSQKVSPVVYEKTGTLAAGTGLHGVSMFESAIPTGHIEGGTATAFGIDASSATSSVEATTAVLVGVGAATSAAGLVETATVMTGVVE